jgi:hypothetical protein
MIAEAAPIVQPTTPPNRQRATTWCRNHAVSVQTFHRWRLRPDGPPAYRIFGIWYVDPRQMEDWISGRSTHHPASAIAAPALSARRRAEIETAMTEARELMHSR